MNEPAFKFAMRDVFDAALTTGITAKEVHEWAIRAVQEFGAEFIYDGGADDEDDTICVNAHDRCFGGAGGPCPYCEKRKGSSHDAD